VSSALETFVIIALYKSTFTIPYHTITLQAYRQGTKFLLLIAALQYAVIYPGRRNLPGVRVTWMRSTW